jgi:SagB-type dehydrogenase family enzyme
MDPREKARRHLRVQVYEGTETNVSDTTLGRFRRHEFSRESDLAELFHEQSRSEAGKRYPPDGRGVELFINDDAYRHATNTPVPGYRYHESVALPTPTRLEHSIGEVLAGRRSDRSFSADPISMEDLSNLLYYGCGSGYGTQEWDDEPSDDEAPPAIDEGHRTYPSPGRLYTVEPYVVVVNGGQELDRGVYYYRAEGHGLQRLETRDEEFPEEFRSMWQDTDVIDYRDVAISILLVGVFWRAKAKYGIQGYRLLLKEAGHMCQNLQLVAGAMGLNSVPSASYRESDIQELLDLNGVDADVVHSLMVGQQPEEEGDDG